MTIYLTYDNETQQDGLGAQALRIVGIFSLAKLFMFKYLHSPIIDVLEEFSHKLESESELNLLIERVNDFFSFPCEKPPKKVDKVIKVRNPGVKVLLRYRLRYLLSKEIVVLKVLLPFGVTDRWPMIYSCAIRYLRKVNRKQLVTRNIVVAHIRWGYGYFYSDQKYIRARHLPFTYFTDILKEISCRYYASSNFSIVVHTDVSPEDTVWKPAQKRVIENYLRD